MTHGSNNTDNRLSPWYKQRHMANCFAEHILVPFRFFVLLWRKHYPSYSVTDWVNLIFLPNPNQSHSLCLNWTDLTIKDNEFKPIKSRLEKVLTFGSRKENSEVPRPSFCIIVYHVLFLCTGSASVYFWNNKNVCGITGHRKMGSPGHNALASL